MSSSHAVLIVDADPKGLEALVYGFQGADWRTTACPTPETASLLVKTSDPTIVVIASRAEHEKVQALIRQIRAEEAFRTLPLLVLGPEELRNPLKKISDVDLLPLPAFVRDVLTASQLLVEAGAAAAQKPGEELSFAPPIATTTTLSLIRTMCGLARSGMLHLERKDRHGEILFHEGELTAAQVGQLQGMAAVQHVLIWNDGAFDLHLRPVVRRGQLHQTSQEFIEEFDRFQRDFAHAMKDIGPPTTVYSIIEERLHHSTNAVPAEVTPVVRLCDSQRTLSDIIDESPFRVLDTVRIVARLVELAILVRRDPKPESDAKAARPPLEEFWATARIVGPSSPKTRARSEGVGGPERPIPPTPHPATSTSPEVRSESNSPDEEKGRTHKKTLEIATTLGRGPAPEVSPSVVVPAALAAQAEPATDATTNQADRQDAITVPLGGSFITDKRLGAGDSHEVPTQSNPVPVNTPAAHPTTQVPNSSTQSPFVNLPVTGMMQESTAGQPGTARSPFAPVPKTAATGTQASGIIEPRERRTRSTLRSVPAQMSVVVDTAQIEVAKAPTSAASPDPVSQSPVVQNPMVVSPVLQDPAVLGPIVQSPKLQSPVEQGATVPPSPVADTQPESAVPKITGEFVAAPSRRTSRQMPVQPRMSIQLDATLVSDPKEASAPIQVTDTPKIEPSPTRLTGEMKVAPSGRHTRDGDKPKRASSSFHIDPSLATEAPTAAKTPQPLAVSSQPVASSTDKRHQSGNFSPLEKDFFERESELYEVENTESFADLEEKQAKAAGKHGATKKPGQPNRK